MPTESARAIPPSALIPVGDVKVSGTISAGRIVVPVLPRIKLSWATTEQMIDILAAFVQPHAYTHVIGVARGGLTPAVMLSHRLKLPMHIVTAKGYDDKMRKLDKIEFDIAGNVSRILSNNGFGTKPIVIDDIFDSGRTYDTLRQVYPKIPNSRDPLHYACLVAKAHTSSLSFMHHHVMRVPPDTWVEFPWETQQ
jgi:hypoxanthine phosphoribosyltransferase